MANLSNINGKFLFTDGDFLLIGGATANSISATESGVAIKNSNAATLSLQNSAANGKNHTLGSNTDGSFNITDVGVATRFTIHSGGDVFFPESLRVGIGVSSIYPQSDDAILKIYSPNNGGSRLYLQSESTGTTPTDGSQIYIGTSDLNISNMEGKTRFYNEGFVMMDISKFDGSANANPLPTSSIKIWAGSKTGWLPGDILSKIEFYSNDVSGIGARNAASIRVVNETGDGSTTTTFSGALAFYTSAYNSTEEEAMRIGSSGNVGIGTDSPNDKLHVSSAGSDTYVRIGNNAGYDAGIYFNTSTDWTIGTDTSNSNAFTIDNGSRVGSNSKIVIKTDGNVGIGTDSPDEKLSVNGNIFLQGNDGYIAFNTSASSGHPKIKMNSDADFSFLNTAGSNLLHIENGGNIGIGTTSPNAKLHVDGTFFAAASFSSYTPDGLYNSNARPSKIYTPSGQEILFGFFDNGAGGYFPRIGFKQDYDAVGSPFTTTAKTSFGLEIDGRMSFKVGASNSIEALSISSGGYIKALPTYSLTTATAANMHIDSNGTFYRSTSSLKYKKDVTDYDKGLNEVMQLKPKYYKGKTNGDKQFAGLIAEDVHDLGLTEFVQYADDGSPDALSYTHMIALLTKSIQELKVDNDNLRERIQTLENN